MPGAGDCTDAQISVSDPLQKFRLKRLHSMSSMNKRLLQRAVRQINLLLEDPEYEDLAITAGATRHSYTFIV